MSEFKINVNNVKAIAQEITAISRELDILKKQCEDMKRNLALPHSAGASVRVRLNESINKLEEPDNISKEIE